MRYDGEYESKLKKELYESMMRFLDKMQVNDLLQIVADVCEDTNVRKTEVN